MPSTPEFEYTYRWADGLDADALEARDQALEAHLANFGGSCSVDFEYPYRWGQILANPDPKVQIELLTANMEALEQAVTASGGCTLEFPFRWTQFWEALVAGESWAIGIAEENDRAIEFRFGRCTCAAPASIPAFIYVNGGDYVPTIDAAEYTFAGSGNLTSLQYFAGPTLNSLEVFVNGISVGLLSGAVVASDTVALSEPIVFGDVLRVEVDSTSLFGFPEVLVFTDGTEPDTIIGWDA